MSRGGSDSGKDRGEWPAQDLPRTWAWAPFTSAFSNETTSDRKLAQKSYESEGVLAVVDQGQSAIAGYTSDATLQHPSALPVLVFGDHTRCVKFVDFPFVQGADGVKVLRPRDALDARFAFHALRTVVLPDKGYARHFKFLSATDFPVPPLNEQRRIVAKLEALQARSRRAREALDAVPPLLEKLRQSILAAAFRGDLTKDWRAKHKDVEPASELLKRIRAERRKKWEESELAKMKAKGKTPTDDKWKARYKEPERPVFHNGEIPLPVGWTWASVSDLTECLDALREPITRSARKAGPYPYYGANGLVDSVAEYIFDEPLVLVTEDETFYGRTKPIAYQVEGKCWVNNHAHVLRAVAPIPSRFICQTLMHYPVIRWLSGTTGRAKLTQGALSTIPIGLPPLSEIEEIGRRVALALERETNVLPYLRDASTRTDAFMVAILRKAFRGELVPQDPNDESAEAMLARTHGANGVMSRGAAETKGTKRCRGSAVAPVRDGA